MSLIAHYPLVSNGDNLGLEDTPLTTMGTVTYTPGKLGNAATFIGDSANCLHRPGLNMKDNFSWCCWFKCNGSTDKAYQFILSEGRDYGIHGFNLILNGNGTDLSINSTNNINIMTISQNKWYHIVITVSSVVGIKIYINGSLIKTAGYVEPDYAYSNDRFAIGKMSYSYTDSNNFFPYNGQLCDVRIYDNCLSPLEIKQISQSLMCHYKLSGIGGENLLKGCYSCTSTKDNFTYVGDVICTLTADEIINNQGKTLTLSYRVKSNGNYTAIDSGSWQSNRFGIHGYISYINTSGEGVTSYPFSDLLSAGKVDGLYYVTWTIPTNIVSITNNLVFSIQTDPSSGFAKPSSDNSETWYIRNIKLEWGNKYTPWCPNKNDALYSTLGYNNNTEYDCSGYGNNGTKQGSITLSSDSPRYSGSYGLNGSECITFNNPIISSSTEFSISCWVKFDTASTANTICTMRTAVGNGIALFRVKENAFRFDDNTQKTFSNYTVPINEWLHVVVTRSPSAKKLYVNGELKQTTTSVGDMGNISQKGSIGASSENGSNFNNFTTGNISDFRIYATALSATDVKQLYNVSASIDKSGILAAYEFVEEG